MLLQPLALQAFGAADSGRVTETSKEKELPANPPKTTKPAHEAQAFGITIENDTKNIGGPGSDQAYSNGIKLSYVYAKDHVPMWAPNSIVESSFLKGMLENSKANFGIGLNHQFYTPNNVHLPTLQYGDRPYAAWLNLAFSMHLRNAERSHSFELSLGAVGPVAMGESVQNGFHRIIGADFAEGWGTQINNEPAIQLSYQQRLHFFSLRNRFGPWFDLIPMFGAGLGNVFIGAHSGMIARIGINLPDDFGPARPSSGESDSFVSPAAPSDDLKSSYYIFAGARGNAVARNIFLDGNTFRPSHHVTKYPFTAETEFGVGVQIMPISLVWRFVVRSPDFEENSGFNSFASVGLTYFTR
ncbi:lipid A deacylase LpxR family protein [soil metagenome]